MPVAKRPRTRAPGSTGAADTSQAQAKAEETEEKEEQAKAEDTEEETTEEYSKTTSKKSSKTAAEEPDEEEKKEESASAVQLERQRVASIRKHFAAKDSDFALEAIDEGWSLNEAKAVYCDRLMEGKAKSGAKADSKSPGLQPLTSGRGDDEPLSASELDAHPFMAKVATYEAKGMARDKAVSQVVRDFPQLHQEFVQAANPGMVVAV